MRKFSLLATATVAVLGVAACVETGAPPAEPEPVTGPVEAPNSLNGTYNLVASDCIDDDTPMTRLVIDGNRFNFYELACVVANSEARASDTRVTLSCTGEGQDFNRVLDLQTRADRLRVTDDSRTVTYFKCGG